MIGKTISHYKINEKIGEGGMGEVYLADDLILERKVAIKFLPEHLTKDKENVERFEREAKAAAALNHPNIITIHEIAEHDDQTFIVMEYVDGDSLRTKIDKGVSDFNEILNITRQICQGLSEAHKADIVHRDIKPENILIDSRERVKILDFGLAKLKGASKLTKETSTLGTIHYMSPEQARGEKVDQRSDIWSLGVVLYEMLAGQLPFTGEYEQAVIYSIINDDPAPINKANKVIPPEVEHIVNRALKKNREWRYSSAAEMLEELKQNQASLRTAEMGEVNLRTYLRRTLKLKIVIPAVCILLGLLLVGVWFVNRQAKIRWAKEEALPEIERLIESAWGDFSDAYNLAEKAERYISNDPKLTELLSKCSFHISINTEPPGAEIFMKEYKSPSSEWEYLGVSPIEKIRFPIGIFRWKMEMEGFETVMAASSTWDIDLRKKNALIPNDLVRVLDEKQNIPLGMVRVSGAQTSLGKLDDFFIDKYEVTNKQYKEFVDSGGYRNKEYWQHPFIKDDKVLTWNEAMAEFIDQTERPGPASWQAGNYPDGQGDYPVSGISWYEAAAYAAFVGKSLPTGKHWGLARGEMTPLIRWPHFGGFAIFYPFCNFEGRGPVPVGSLPGITSYGAYDMAGNVREWCWNKTQNGRLIRGGAWNDITYMFSNLSQAPAFDRSVKNGFRCALYPDSETIPESVFGMVKFGEGKDYYKEKPVSDDIFQVYKEQFSYDKKALNPSLEVRDAISKNWLHERIIIDAAYSDEQIIIHLFLPQNTAPPYQTVIFFPAAGAVLQKTSDDLERYYGFSNFLSFILKNGRAVLFPVYKGTFERREDDLSEFYGGENSHRYTEYLIQLIKDFKRCIDYLEIRHDIDHTKLAYYGVSWGAELGAVIPAVEERLKASILIAGGFYRAARNEANQINYVTRVSIPTLMLNGKYDTVSPYATSIKPMFDLLGTPDENKELKLYDTDHLPPKNEFIKEILAWLDRYLGPVQ